jgi:hypothetical protein
MKIEDNGFRYVVHARDHFTKFSWAEPLKQKKAIGVAQFLHKLFCYWGTPAFLQSDNGREFVNKVVNEHVKHWGNIVFIHGRPRHPQSQGLVENANKQLRMKLWKWMAEKGRSDWTFALDVIIMRMNNHVCSTTKHTAYELVFGQQQRANLQVIKDLWDAGVKDEEAIGDFANVEYHSSGK